MCAARKPDLDRRLEAHFAALRSPSLKDVLKRSAGNWQLYAAVTGSAMAMVTSASAAMIGSGIRDIMAERVASVRLAKQPLASSKNPPFATRVTNGVRFAMALPGSGRRSITAADVKVAHASQAQAPSISPGGIVPLDSTVNTIQPGELVSIFGTNLASGIAYWNGDFPILLGGTSVQINGKSAYLMFVSPGQ